jgi:hypothetical protein
VLGWCASSSASTLGVGELVATRGVIVGGEGACEMASTSAPVDRLRGSSRAAAGREARGVLLGRR